MDQGPERNRNIVRTESATVELCSKPPSGLTCGTPGPFLQRRRDVLAHVSYSCHVNHTWGSSAYRHPKQVASRTHALCILANKHALQHISIRLRFDTIHDTWPTI